MTEIVRTTSTVVTTDIMLSKTTTKAKTTEHVMVRSIRSDRLDASVVRAFVAALDQAEAPGRTRIDGYRSDGHLIQLEAKWENEIAQPEDDPTGQCSFCGEVIQLIGGTWRHERQPENHEATPVEYPHAFDPMHYSQIGSCAVCRRPRSHSNHDGSVEPDGLDKASARELGEPECRHGCNDVVADGACPKHGVKAFLTVLSEPDIAPSGLGVDDEAERASHAVEASYHERGEHR